MIELITVSRGIPVNDCTSVIIGVVQLVEPVINQDQFNWTDHNST
jgi:hypothetical protein